MLNKYLVCLLFALIAVVCAQANYEILFNRPDITGLTGGGAANLDGISTTGLAVGTILIIYDGSETRIYRLTAGTDAENSPTIIRPDDYNVATNAKVWKARLSSNPTETGYSGDNLGNHTATENIQLDGYYLSSDGDDEGIYINGAGNVGIGTATPQNKLDVEGAVAIGATYSGTSAAPANGMIVQGNVGIGTATPRTRLELGTDGAILAIGTYGAGWTEPNLGAGTRMLWYPKKAALRAGYVDGTQWNDANVGDYSIATGYYTTASGFTSTAMGNNTTASASGSTAMGISTTASGFASTAIGRNTTASGLYSTATGWATTASGQSSFSVGQYVTAGPANYTIALGHGVDDANRLVNNTTNSLMVGFNSDIPTLFIGPSSGIGTTGNVGIGNAIPAQKLDVSGDINIASGSGIRINNTATAGQYLRGNGTRFVSSTIQSADLPGSFSGFSNPSASIGLSAVNGAATTAMRSDAAPALSQAIIPTWTGTHTFSNGTYSALFTGGNVGIGITNPGAKLEVAGQVKITGGTPGNGKVLTSDASGLASWQTPSSGGASKAAYDIFPGGSITLTGSFQTIQSKAITTGSAGTILVLATGDLYLSINTAVVGISKTDDGIPLTSQEVANANTHSLPYGVQYAEHLSSAGTYTYYFVAEHSSGGNTIRIFPSVLTVLFVPD